MTPLEVQVRLAHIIDAGEKVLRYTSGKSFEEYTSDELVGHAVERLLTIIGEAVTRIAKTDPATAARLGDFPRIIAFRNQLVHNYPNVDDNAVWLIVQRELPLLVERIRRLLPPPS
ncbi:MAG TPA: HepT-like ribonuclease domain-containing protein [Thermoanaerobaculia bacterium]|jgi:uncharacterized protein with HEPN domain|nr:HepT-like ribonuclease domain-containing protein [Thermoanaerobaculia bacterium]